MKKSLLAVAAIGAFASAAQAQSSVTVYGILDVGYVGGNAKASTINSTNAPVNVSETVSLLGQSAQQSSRLGFRGTEDLGGGLSAMFTLETGLNPNASTLSSFNNRQSFVGLSKKGLGMAAVGTQYTLIHTAVAATSSNKQNNLVGDLIYPQNTGLTNQDGSANNANAGYTVRSSNMLLVKSDSFAGFKANAFYVANNKDANQATLSASSTNVTARTGISGGTTNSTGYGLGVDYTWNKLLVTANYQSFKTESAYSTFTNTTPVTLSGGTASAGAIIVTTGSVGNITDNQAYAGATYDFGILKAYAQYINRKEISGFDSNQFAKRTAQQIGVSSYVTPTVEVWSSAGMGRYTAFGAGNPTANVVGYQLGTNYWLSKRTNLYGIFGAANTSSVSGTVPVTNTTTATSAVRSFSSNLNNYAVGVRHTF